MSGTLLAGPVVTTSDVFALSSGTVTLSSAPLVIVASSSPITQTLAVNVLGTQGTIVVTVTSGTFASALVVWSTSTSGGGGAGSTAVNLPTVSAAGFAPVTSSAGLVTNLSSGTVSLSSQITVTATGPVTVTSGTISLSSQITVTATGPVTITSGTVTLSSNPTVVSASSGVIQLSSQITVTATGPVTVTSGLISVTSGTITSTSATNPWSSAPGFNIPTVSVSSGLSQISAIQVSPTSSIAGAGLVVITSSFGLVTQSTQPITITSGTVTLSSVHTVTATAGTNPWSSAPGFNIPVVTVSSGLSQVFLPVTSVAGFGPVTSSAGQVVNLSSGTVTLSSVHTVTATAGTNPWSSAPGFNMPVVSVSSGLIQLTVPTLMSIATTAATPVGVLVTSSGGPVFSAGVNTAAGYGPVTSSAGRLSSLSSGTVTLSSNPTVISASSGLVQISGTPLVTITSSAAIAPATVIATTVSKIGAGAGVLYRLQGFTTAPTGAILRLYNATTANVAMGTAVVAYCLAGAQSTVGNQTQDEAFMGVRGMNFPTACSFDSVLTATSTLVTAAKTFVTFQYV